MELISIENKIKKTEAVLNNVFKLHSMPKVLGEILQYLNSDSVNNTTLSKMILRDQSLATKILAIANSPLYGLQRNVTTIDFAVMVLGVEEIKHIVSSLSMMDTFKNKTDDYLDQAKFWEHSFLVALISKKIAEDFKMKYVGEIFTAGFLHDLGLPIIHRYFHSSFVKIKEDIELAGTNFIEAERETIGLTHAEIAYRLLDKWNLPVILCDITKHHHAPLNSEEFPKQTAVVHLADYTTKYLSTGSFFWNHQLELDFTAAKLIGFKTDEEVIEYIEQFRSILPQQLESMRHLL